MKQTLEIEMLRKEARRLHRFFEMFSDSNIRFGGGSPSWWIAADILEKDANYLEKITPIAVKE